MNFWAGRYENEAVGSSREARTAGWWPRSGLDRTRNCLIQFTNLHKPSRGGQRVRRPAGTGTPPKGDELKSCAFASRSFVLSCLMCVSWMAGCSPSTGAAGGTGGASHATGGSQASGTGTGASAVVTATGGVTVGSGGATVGNGSGGVGAGSGGSASASGGTGIAGAGSAGRAGTGGTIGGAGPGNAGGSLGSGGSAGALGTNLPKFSFFVTSLVAMRALSKSQNGFGGDLTYGQADGLSGADKICGDVAEMSMPGSSAKQWRAFLSVTKGPAGTPINAADRIGKGPWYDRLGRVVAMTVTDLVQNRPSAADPAIKEDLPNESGLPNHTPDPTQPEADNHHVLTGSGADGKLYTVNAKSTCLDWTTTSMDNTMTGRPRIGFSWSISNRTNWISGQDEGGCGAGVAVAENGASDPKMPFVGSGGGYGGIYCFALTP